MSSVPDPLKVFQKLHNNSIKDIVSIHYQPTDEDDVLELPKDQQIEALAEDVVASGADALLNSLQKSVLLNLVEGLVLDYPPEKNKTASGVLKKGLYNLIDDVGVEDFLNQLTLAKVQLICHSLKLEESGDKSTLDKRIIDYVNERGLKAFFSQFVEGELKQWCVDNHLMDSDDHSSYSKQSLLNALIHRQPVTKDNKSKKPEKPHLNLKKRPKIKAGISAADVFQWYTKAELLEYCNKEGISKKGKFRQIATRVAKHVNGEKVEMLGEPKKRKRGSKGKEKSQKKARVDKNESTNKEKEKDDLKEKETEKEKKTEKEKEKEKDDHKEKEKEKRRSADVQKKEKE